jgi:hypothetical protein
MPEKEGRRMKREMAALSLRRREGDGLFERKNFGFDAFQFGFARKISFS